MVCKPVHYFKNVRCCSGHWETKQVSYCPSIGCCDSCTAAIHSE